MTKSKKEVQREIYDYIEEEYAVNGKPVILQQILDKFCNKYNVSEPTITRYINELVERKKGPFKLETWFDGNRYYTIHTISLRMQIYLVLSVFIPIAFFIVDLLNILHIKLLERSLIFIFAFWFSIALNRIKKTNKIVSN